MIHKLILKNFKRVKDEVFEFTNFDLIVGANNSGKSTALQAMAIWQYCVDQFKLTRKKGSRGIQVVLPNFTALPLPEFNLLWTDRTDRESVEDTKKPSGKTQAYIYIEIDVYWKADDGEERNFCVQIRYQSPQAVFAIPKDGWSGFSQKSEQPGFPRVVYVPPFSGLEPHEKWIDDGNVRQQIGKAQPGSVLRNLLFRVIDRDRVPVRANIDWQEIVDQIRNWFGIELLAPLYEKGISTELTAEYRVNKKTFDVISGGSGFHQILTLLAFVYGYPEVSTILFDEPDAHLHVNLQRKIVNYFKAKSTKQFLIATHSEEFIKGVEIDSILSVLSGKPRRVPSSHEVLHALSDIDNNDIVRTQNEPYILYLEGEDDERLLSAWANILGKTEVYQKFYPYPLGGSTKREMRELADRHYRALKQINSKLKRIILLDQDGEDNAINPPDNQEVLNEWKRRNIDNYLLVPNAWKRAVSYHLNEEFGTPTIFSSRSYEVIDNFFQNQNLTLPPRSNWTNVQADIFKIVDGKKMLFERADSLFEQIKELNILNFVPSRLAISSQMTRDEIHDDIVMFFKNLEKVSET